jgi:nitrate reductase gamma subunit
MNSLNTFLFGLYPYIALFICFIASWIRYDREQYTWKPVQVNCWKKNN